MAGKAFKMNLTSFQSKVMVEMGTLIDDEMLNTFAVVASQTKLPQS